jgi:mannose-6-phosphate isomerase-like protein (cupin superfamily)
MTQPTAQRSTFLSAGDGAAYWWTGALATLKLSAEQTAGHMSLVEVLVDEGYAAPLHVHHREDEAFWILEGTVDFRVGHTAVTAVGGDLLFGPRDVPHRYTVVEGPARMLFSFTPGGFEGFVRDAGEPARARTTPPADVRLDMEQLSALATRYGAELLDA